MSTDTVTDTEPRTYRIPAENRGELAAKFEKLAKRAERIGVPAPTFTVVETESRVVDGQVFEADIITVDGEAPRYAGWGLLGTIELDHEEPDTPNVVGIVPGLDIEIDPEWRATGDRCDHCGVANRGRSKLVIVEHETGERKIVGTTCLRDFLGHTAPDAIAAWCEMLAELDDEVREFEESRGGGETRFDPEAYLAFVARSIRENGWVSRGSAGWTDTATADDAATEMRLAFGGQLPKGMTEADRPAPPTEAELTAAREAIAWGREQSGSSYLDNVAAVCQKGSIRHKHFGIIASVVASHQKAQARWIEEKARREAQKDSEHFGEVKDRVEIAGTVTFVRFFDGDYGTRALVKILTDEGNMVTWWCSNADNAPAQGDKVSGKATIKGHDVYEGVAQTTITRAKLAVEPEPAPEGEVIRETEHGKVVDTHRNGADRFAVEDNTGTVRATWPSLPQTEITLTFLAEENA